MHTDLGPILVRSCATILTAMEALDKGGLQIVLVVDASRRLLATLTDGDVRRGLLQGVSLQDTVERVMRQNPIVVSVGVRPEAIRQIMQTHHIRQIPVLDGDGVVVGLASYENPEDTFVQDTQVVLMAGGLGMRLRPLTEEIPKPMLRVGEKPLLELIVRNFVSQGFRKFHIAVNYRREIIQDYFGNGDRFDCSIEYIVESTRMGTAGALTLLPRPPSEPFLVMNGDLLTSVNFLAMLEHHNKLGSFGTIGAREYSFEVPFGVIRSEGEQLLEIVEKPVHRQLVSAGIYVLSPEVFDILDGSTCIDMPDLFKNMISRGMPATVFPLREYWLDIGAASDLERARQEFAQVFSGYAAGGRS